MLEGGSYRPDMVGLGLGLGLGSWLGVMSGVR